MTTNRHPGAGQEQAGTTSSQAAAGRTGVAAGKLQIPQLSVAALRRDRVTSLIGQAGSHRVTVVSAPAGSGKTVACAAWAAAVQPPRRVGWVTLDSSDSEPDRFWTHVQAAVSAQLHGGEAPAACVAAQQPGGVAAQLAGASPLTLVLDDVHELAGSPVPAGIDQLIRLAPDSFRLILTGRYLPPLQLAKLRMSGDVADITGGDLACTAAEVSDYFAMAGHRLQPAERDELLRRTEGWMAGLRLAAMTGQAAAVRGSDPAVADYLRDEVIGRQPPQIQRFMLRTSVTEQISGELADALTGELGGAAALERLSRHNSLVTAAGTGGSYRYHPLLRQALAAERARQIPGEVPGLAGRAARWHAAHSQPAAALRCAAAAGDWDYASSVLADAAVAALAAGGADALEDVLTQFPPQRRSGDAAVAAACAAARLWRSDPDGAAAHLDSAAAAASRSGAVQRRQLGPWLAALQLLHAASFPPADTGLVDRAAALAQRSQATATTPPQHQVLGLLWLAVGIARLRGFEAGAAGHALNHACGQLTAGGLAGLAARARGWQAVAQAWHGDLAAAERAVSEHLAAAARAGTGGDAGPRVDPGDPGASQLAALASAQVSLARDDVAGARRLLDAADGPAQYGAGQFPGEPSLAVVSGLVRARAAVASGDTPGARALLTRLRDVSAPGDRAVAQIVAQLEVSIALHAGDLERARTALTREAGSGVRSGAAGTALLEGQLLLAQSNFGAAISAVAPITGGAAADLTVHTRIAGLLVAAVASRRAGDNQSAARGLQDALALAEPDDAFAVFLDAGQAARSAITVLVGPASHSARFASRVLERFDTQLPASRGSGEPGAGQEGGNELTDSELAVLRFLPSHLTNQEIGESLFLSVNTVKTHLRAAYRKLGVDSRRAAIARARRLGLLLVPAVQPPQRRGQDQQDDAVEQQPGGQDSQQQRQRNAGPEQHDSTSGDAEQAGQSAESAPGRRPGARGHRHVGHSVHDPERPEQERQQENGLTMMAHAEQARADGDQADKHIASPGCAAGMRGGEAFSQAEDSADDQGRAKQDRRDGQRDVGPDQQHDADRQHPGSSSQNHRPGPAGQAKHVGSVRQPATRPGCRTGPAGRRLWLVALRLGLGLRTTAPLARNARGLLAFWRLLAFARLLAFGHRLAAAGFGPLAWLASGRAVRSAHQRLRYSAGPRNRKASPTVIGLRRGGGTTRTG